MSLHYEYLLGASTIRKIVKDTCEAIWDCLVSEYMPPKNYEEWLQVARQFYERTQFPNCVGAIDGKHIRVKCPGNSGSDFFNYKSFFSVVLLAVTDADYRFVAIDVGSYGCNNDSFVLSNSKFGKMLIKEELKIPDPALLPNDTEGNPMPFLFVADEAFANSKHIMRPYARRNLSYNKRIFNYRLTRARRMVECSFGILASKWRILTRAVDVNIEFCDFIIKACCILHNYVRARDGVVFEETLFECPIQSLQPDRTRGNATGLQVREYLTQYFTSPQGCVSWQYDRV